MEYNTANLTSQLLYHCNVTKFMCEVCASIVLYPLCVPLPGHVYSVLRRCSAIYFDDHQQWTISRLMGVHISAEVFETVTVVCQQLEVLTLSNILGRGESNIHMEGMCKFIAAHCKQIRELSM